MNREKVLLLLIPLTLSLGFGYSQVLTPEASSGPQSTDCVPTTLELPSSDPYSGLGKPPLYFILRNQEDWKNFYRNVPNPPELSAHVDFQKEMLVAFTFMTQKERDFNELKINKVCVLHDGFRIEFTLSCFVEKPMGLIHIVSGARRWKSLAVVLPQSQLPVTVTGQIVTTSPELTPISSSSSPN
jgi:hypothetical protein